MADEETTAEEIEEEDAAAEEKPKGSGKTKIIMIIVGVLLALAAAGGISYYVVTQYLHSANNPVDPEKNHDPGVFVKLGKGDEGLMVNVGGIKGGHFLKIGIVLELNPGKQDNVTKDHKVQPIAETKILDTVLHILRSEKLESFDATKQDDLKEKIRSELNKALGGGSVYSVYITSFILQ